MPIQLQSYSTKQLEPYKLLTDLRALADLANKLEAREAQIETRIGVLTTTVEGVASSSGGGGGAIPTPIGPFPSVIVSPTGALDGDGTAVGPLGVRVDGTTIQINSGNRLEVNTAAIIPAHNSLSGLQGGTAGEYYHLTAAEHTGLTGLTSPRIPYATAAGVLGDNAVMTWDNTNTRIVLSVGGGATLAVEAGINPKLLIAGDFTTNGATGQLQLDGYDAQPSLIMRRTNGTPGTPTALANLDIIFNFRSVGYDGSASALGGLLRMIANGAWTGTNHGQDFLIALTANGSTAAPSEVMRVRNNPSGTVGINFTAPGAALEVHGTPVDIGYLIKARPTSTGSAYLQCQANGASNQAGFSYTQLSNSREWRNAVIGNDGDALRWGGGTGGTDVKMYLTQEGNLIINDTRSDPTTGTKMLIFGDGAAPTAMASNSTGLFGNDVSGTVNLFGINEAAEITQLTGGIGYPTGQGGTVTQGAGSGKATGVTLSKYTGEITMNNATLNSDTTVSFALTNTKIATSDLLVLNHVSGGTIGAYLLEASCGASTATIYVRNITGGNLGEAIVIRFAVIRGAVA
jgi:hypothetical protein